MSTPRSAHAKGDGGQATLETIGMTIVAAVVATSVIGAVAGGSAFTRSFSGAVCSVTGGCASGSAGAPSGDSVPSGGSVPSSGPCAVDGSSGATASGGCPLGRSAFVAQVAAGTDRVVRVEQLSNGTYRVAVTDAPGAGSTPVPASPHDLSPSALPAAVTQLYSADTTADMNAIVSEARYDQVMDAAVTPSPIGDSRGLIDWSAQQLGMGGASGRAPVATTHGGGVSTTAAAAVQAIIDNPDAAGGGGAGGEVTSVQTNADGSQTVSVTAGTRTARALGSGLLGPSAGDASGGLSLSAQYDLSPSGDLTAVRTSVVAPAADGEQVVTTQALPVSSAADRTTAQAVISAVSHGSSASGASGGSSGSAQTSVGADFAQAAQETGSATALTYRDGGPDARQSANLPTPIALEVPGAQAIPSLQAIDASRWDGQQWSTWPGCTG